MGKLVTTTEYYAERVRRPANDRIDAQRRDDDPDAERIGPFGTEEEADAAATAEWGRGCRSK